MERKKSEGGDLGDSLVGIKKTWTHTSNIIVHGELSVIQLFNMVIVLYEAKIANMEDNKLCYAYKLLNNIEILQNIILGKINICIIIDGLQQVVREDYSLENTYFGLRKKLSTCFDYHDSYLQSQIKEVTQYPEKKRRVLMNFSPQFLKVDTRLGEPWLAGQVCPIELDPELDSHS
ncbi:hypothetical protein SAMN05444487_102270 [Marininema mesophilum]|uniref:Uncharacterized protein n=1 Tax=Marininema mesophilum TaxID=1048340 RepID=A0A1H2SPF9_9BACL|nr:hypothetical protein [Marininema mesophilum]SDW33407.1 hypothetical protein SAMN05444487_102270 [Marininema mesophilum]